MLVKVCGMREADNIRDVEALQVDLIGFIFWPHSVRFVAEKPAYLPHHARRVGVFVDADDSDICRYVEDFGLDVIQLHGHETPGELCKLRACPTCAQTTLVKAFNIAGASDFQQTLPYEGLADLFLFDTKGKSVGGNGVKFDWDVLADYHGSTPFLLSGGIGPDDAPGILAFQHAQCVGIDLNSRFEIAPGLKDIPKLKTFIESINSSSLSSHPLPLTPKKKNHE